MTSDQVDVLIVGGGIAGTCAARAASATGARTLLIDEGTSEQVRDSTWSEGERLRDARQAALAAGVEIRRDSLAWGIFPGLRVAVAGATGVPQVLARAVVLSTGAVTITEPTPGWTQPEIRLALMIECSAGYSDLLGGWVPKHSSLMTTSVEGIYVAGDCAGLCADADFAAAEGTLAGASAARDLGFGDDALVRDALEALTTLAPERIRAAEDLDGWYVQLAQPTAPPASAYEFENRDGAHRSSVGVQSPIVCPCEEVSSAAVLGAIASGARTLNDVKRRTRAGMGACQGIKCGHPIRTMICAETGADPSSVPPMTARPPVRLLPLAAFAHSDSGENARQSSDT